MTRIVFFRLFSEESATRVYILTTKKEYGFLARHAVPLRWVGNPFSEE
jgi:hypothetical protein